MTLFVVLFKFIIRADSLLGLLFFITMFKQLDACDCMFIYSCETYTSHVI